MTTGNGAAPRRWRPCPSAVPCLAGLATILILAAVTTAAGRTWLVPAEAPTIQAGVDSAAAGDTLLIAAGVYYEHVVTEKDLVMLGATGDPADVVIDGEGTGTCLDLQAEMDGSLAVSLQGLGIRHGGSAGLAACCAAYFDVTLRNCLVQACGTGLELASGSLEIEDCTVQDCGTGMFLVAGAVMRRVILRRNDIGIHMDEHLFLAENCLLANNGTAVWIIGPENMPTLCRCTVVGNELAFSLRDMCALHVAYSIVADNGMVQTGVDTTVVGTECDPPREAVKASWPNDWLLVNCTNLWNNGDGDWTGPLAALQGVAGNVSVDPRFCDPAAGDYSLHHGSPLLPERNACGLIGAFDAGDCTFDDPYFASLADVPGDQGGQLRLRWIRSDLDAPASPTPITGYSVWRRIDLAERASAAQPAAPPVSAARMAYPPGAWEYVTTVPARGELEYATVAPTLCDSTAAGPCWSVFFVSAMTADPLLYFDSEPDSGASRDDLAPPAPTGLAVAYAAQANSVSWLPSAAPDVALYRVYAGRTGQAFPGEGLAAEVTATSWHHDLGTDPEPAWDFLYWVAAVDVHGNEGPPTAWQEASLTGAAPPAATPAFGILAVRPNPFNPRTTVVFALARPAAVDLAVYDLAGRRVRTLLAAAPREPGRHEAAWDGRDDQGRVQPAGLYLCRLRAGEQQASARLLLLK